MKYPASHRDLKNAGWACIHLDDAKVVQARRDKSYYEFFKTAHIHNRYAVFSVPNGFDFFFQNDVDATEIGRAHV